MCDVTCRIVDDLQSYVLGRYRRGDLATLEEGALIAGVTRMTVRRWLVDAGIDWKLTRGRYIAKLRSRGIDASQGVVRRRPHKRQQSAMVKRKTREWLDKGNAIKRDANGAELERIPPHRG